MKSNFMPGAKEEPVRNNPKVHAKADLHGMGRKAPHLSHPGETAPVTGTAREGFTEHGHMKPTEVGRHGQATTHSHEPSAAPMAEGKGYGRKNETMTDSLEDFGHGRK